MTKKIILRNLYFNTILSLFSVTYSLTTNTGSKTSPPKLTLISHTINGDSIDVKTNSTLHLKCSGDKPITWSLPYFNHYDNTSEQQIKSLCDENKIPKCTTDVVIPEVNYEMTGYFTCHYEGSAQTANSNSIYIYVNSDEPEKFIVPYDGGSNTFMLVSVFQAHSATLPCKATSSRAKVSLWQTTQLSTTPVEIIPNNTLGISFNPKKGYQFAYPRWDDSVYECKVEMDGKELIGQIHIHSSILPDELSPMIDGSKTKNILMNSTFTLKCFVRIEIGAFVFTTSFFLANLLL